MIEAYVRRQKHYDKISKQKEMKNDLDGFFEAVSLKEQLRTLNRCLGNELDGGCRDYSAPKNYDYKYGINRNSLLSGVLEKYHQLRLKDKE